MSRYDGFMLVVVYGKEGDEEGAWAEPRHNEKGIRIIWLVCERERWPTNSTHNGLAG